MQTTNLTLIFRSRWERTFTHLRFPYSERERKRSGKFNETSALTSRKYIEKHHLMKCDCYSLILGLYNENKNNRLFFYSCVSGRKEERRKSEIVLDRFSPLRVFQEGGATGFLGVRHSVTTVQNTKRGSICFL